MGSGDWFRTIISRKKTKQDQSKQVKGPSIERSRWRNQTHKASTKLDNGTISGNPRDFGTNIEDIAATRIQTAFRGFKARKALRHLKGVRRLQTLAQGHSVKKQALTTLSHLQSWSKIQMQIRARRVCMVTEGRIRQKRQDSQLKLEAKLHDLEVEWCAGSETMEETLARIQQREAAAIKRERTMAYAFTHQWRANSSLNQGQPVYDLGKGTWGWSWMDRWIAARPWETRLLPAQSLSPNKAKSKAAIKSVQNSNPSDEKTASTQEPNSKSATTTTTTTTTSQPKTKNAQMKQEPQLYSQSK